ncbi:hypothetical protein [Crossiella cryophila]|uniref:Uncharacterized protein n=1 Tax=Crossiella cryophila TaxID=43355 RepID=A0A7W7C8F3_9PSEU|nr:hypothetical protein [Crossiella cryophila]MBB4676467.1 hypothetical protein [Crossiella cryophila]
MSASPQDGDQPTVAESLSSDLMLPVAARVRSRWKLSWWQWAFVGVATTVVIAVSVVAINGAAGTSVYELSGVMSLKDGDATFSSRSIVVLDRTVEGADGMYECRGSRGSRGYRDIAEGAEVKVYDAASKIIAVGSLGKGRAGSQSADVCNFPIAVAKVPVGHELYQVEVSRRGKVTVEASPENGKLYALLRLGD